MNYKLVVEVTFEELLNNYAEAVKTELGRDVEVKCIDTPISVGKVQSTEEATVNTPVETSKKTPKKKTQAKKKEPEVSNDDVEETKPWVQNPEYQKLNNELKEVLDKMDLERNCFTPEYERLAKIMNEISAKITALINSYRSEETLARIHQQMLEEDKLEKSVVSDLDIPNNTEDTESDSEPKEEEETKPLIIPERSREIPADEVAPWEDKKEEKKEDTKEKTKEDKPKSLDELFPHRNDPSAPGLFSQFARND